MDLRAFLETNSLGPGAIDGKACLEALLTGMEEGLAGRGNIPMIPSYLSLDIRPEAGKSCRVLDAGGTNLRFARAEFQESGSCRMTGLTKVPMPGTQGELTAEEFYGQLADYAAKAGGSGPVGLCFSYNVLIERSLDGILQGWCKEVRVPDAPGQAVGASLSRAMADTPPVRVLNDSTAALLGAHVTDPRISLGLILGTGINICYQEACCHIPKVPQGLKGDAMIISTEIGEFDGFPKNPFEAAVIAASDEPELAHAEKQCAGAYLGSILSRAWQAAVEAGLLPEEFRREVSLPQISDYLAGLPVDLPRNDNAETIAGVMIRRAAKIAAVLTAGAVVRSKPQGQCTLVIEGSQFHRLTGFGEGFCRELEALLQPRGIGFQVAAVENSCLMGAALAAFAEPM